MWTTNHMDFNHRWTKKGETFGSPRQIDLRDLPFAKKGPVQQGGVPLAKWRL